MIFEILSMFGVVYIIYLIAKRVNRPKEVPRDIEVKINYTVSDDGDLDSPDISVR